jgi:hypothetical protein
MSRLSQIRRFVEQHVNTALIYFNHRPPSLPNHIRLPVGRVSVFQYFSMLDCMDRKGHGVSSTARFNA